MKKFFSIFLLASVAFLLQATVVDQSTALQLVKSLYGERADSVNYYVGSVEKYVNKYYSPVNTDEAASIDWLSGSDEKWLIAVDEQPLLRWGHDCSYFYIPKEVDSSKEIPHFRVKGSLIPHSLKLQCAEKNIALNLPHRAMRLALPAKQGSAIRLTSVSQSQPAIELALVPGEKSCILDTSSLTAGAYVVNLLVNGDVADSVQVIKK